MVNFLVTFLLTILSISISAMDDDPLIERIPGKVFTCEGLAKSGEKVYFGIEFIDDKNFKEWTLYREVSEKFLVNYVSPSFNLSEEYREDFFPQSGFDSKEEYGEFCDKLIQNTSGVTSDSIYKKETGYKSAIGAFGFDKDAGYYVAYVSKKPIVGYFDHPKPEKVQTFKGYHEGYQSLLMCVRCQDVPNTKVFNNRGIFKGLISCYDLNYSGLSMKLHGFTALVFEKLGKTHMSVAALPSMYQIMRKSIPIESLIDGSDMSESLFPGSVGILDKKCIIDTQTLKSCFF